MRPTWPSQAASTHSAAAGHALVSCLLRGGGDGVCAWAQPGAGPGRSRAPAGRKSPRVCRLLGDGLPAARPKFRSSFFPCQTAMADPEAEVLRSTFPSYMAEGERLYLCGEFAKAAQSFSNAGDKSCLVARSKCYLKMGDLQRSLKDAEASLQGDPTFCKGILQKAETLYTMGDFEFALVFYHRGYKLRPDREFKVGIQKAQEAINNSVGSPSSVKLEHRGDLAFLSKQAESLKAQQQPQPRKPLHHMQREVKRKGLLKSEKSVRQLLGELYVDKEYLEKLLLDKDLIRGTIRSGVTVEDLILTGINYLDTRSSFWQQQKPIYARERDRKLMRDRWLRDHGRTPAQTAHYVLKSLEDVDLLLSSGSAESSLQKAEKVLKKVLEWGRDEVPNRDELLGNLHSCIGNAQLELGQTAAALQSHRRDLEIAQEHNLPDAKSRALDNIGRAFARIGRFQQAIDTWEEKIPLAKTALEKTWLLHEIGRCYLELDQALQAQYYGERSLQYAEEEGDIEWQLNASVLVAQAQVKLRDFQSAVNNFEKALERAKLVHNQEAQGAIISALDDANKGIIEELKKTSYRETLRNAEDAPAVADEEPGAVRPERRRSWDAPERVVRQWDPEPGGAPSEEELRVALQGAGPDCSRGSSAAEEAVSPRASGEPRGQRSGGPEGPGGAESAGEAAESPEGGPP
ncbi:tetratricopeptide repeat protein 25 isoform X2 [Heterocephalus glaber]|uniref:Outer dynein arm-docking complex subunit 4 n=1 Tax=Heterocephalus glaber TaxID=10181 RepID=A0AAX6R1R1_HETGA|nr:tetratricopeptide repeat protein 25 isoform X2 [Heterocephalus glaber]